MTAMMTTAPKSSATLSADAALHLETQCHHHRSASGDPEMRGRLQQSPQQGWLLPQQLPPLAHARHQHGDEACMHQPPGHPMRRCRREHSTRARSRHRVQARCEFYNFHQFPIPKFHPQISNSTYNFQIPACTSSTPKVKISKFSKKNSGNTYAPP